MYSVLTIFSQGHENEMMIVTREAIWRLHEPDLASLCEDQEVQRIVNE